MLTTMPRKIRNKNDNDEAAEAPKEGGKRKESIKKGPWTAAEDAILIEYVRRYGEGNWNSVQKNSGLARCGKSCRLRWANHLRPNLRKGAFSQYEEQIIIELHSKIGNKWARMAAHLPGRTDNEIKNFWNTRMKRCQRAGLPIYPPPSQDKAPAYHLQQQQRYIAQPHSSSFSFSSLPSSSYCQKLNELSYSSAVNPLLNQPDSVYYTNPYQQFNFSNENSGNANLGLPLSPVSPYGLSSSTLHNHCFAAHSAATDSHDYHSGSYNYGFNSSAVTVGSPYEPLPLVSGLNMEISSSQTPQGSATPCSSYSSGVGGLMGASSIADDNYEVATLSPQGNSGLLEALVAEAQALSRNNKSKSENSTAAADLSYKTKTMTTEEYSEEENTVPVESAMKNSGGTTTETQKADFRPFQLPTGKKANGEDPLEEMIAMDDDLFSLLTNFSSELPMPDWYGGGERQSLGLENEGADTSPGPTEEEFARTEIAGTTCLEYPK